MNRIIKFGGSVLTDADSLYKAATIVQAYPGHRVVVCSALKGVTSTLCQAVSSHDWDPIRIRDILISEKEKHLDLLHSLVPPDRNSRTESEITRLVEEALTKLLMFSPPFPPEETAFVPLLGERLSSLLLHSVLKAQGSDAVILLPEEIPLVTDGKSAYPRIDLLRSGTLLSTPSGETSVALVPGFYALHPSGGIRLLGRGGSDYTAAALGFLFDAESVDLWKDVAGFFSGDPRELPGALLKSHLNYEEAAELSYYGAHILHPETIPPLRAKKIPLRLFSFKDSSTPESRHTLIDQAGDPGGDIITGIASTDNIGIITVGGSDVGNEPGILARLTGELTCSGINIKSVLTSQTSINILVEAGDLDMAHRILGEEGSSGRAVIYSDRFSLVSLVGNGINSAPGIAARAFNALAEKKIPVHMICAGASPVSAYFIVERPLCRDAVRTVHDAFFNTREVIYETPAVH